MTLLIDPPVNGKALYDLIEDELFALWTRDGIGPSDRAAAVRLLRIILEREGPASPSAAQLLHRRGWRDDWNCVFAADRAVAVARWVAPFLRAPVLDVLAGDGRVAYQLLELGIAPVAAVERLHHYPDDAWAGDQVPLAEFESSIDLDPYASLLVCATLHHEEDPLALLDRLAGGSARRWVVVENCTDHYYGIEFHQVLDVFFNRCLNSFGLSCVPEHRSAAQWYEVLSRYGHVVAHDRLEHVPGIPFPYDLFVVERTP
jgi:hypothetical protein